MARLPSQCTPVTIERKKNSIICGTTVGILSRKDTTMKHLFTRPPWLTRNLVGFSIASLFGDANHEIVPLMLPLLVTHLVGLHAAPEFVALISGTATALASIAGLFAGNLSDRLTNRKPLITLGYFLTGLLIGLMAFAQHWLVVFLLMVGAWIGRGLVSAPRNAIIADTTSQFFYGHAFGFRQALDTVGSVIGPFMVYLLADWPLSSIFMVGIIPGMLAFIAVSVLVQDVPHTVAAQPLLKNHLPREFYALIGVFFLFGLGGYNKTLLVLRMKELLSPGHTSAGAISTLTLLYIFRNITQTIASYAIGALSDKIGRIIPLLVFGFGFFGLSALMLAASTTSPLFSLLLFFLSGIAAGTYMTLQKAMAADLLPEEVRGTGYGILTTVDSITSLISSVLLGLLWSNTSAKLAFSLVACMSVINCGLLLGIHKKFDLSKRND